MLADAKRNRSGERSPQQARRNAYVVSVPTVRRYSQAIQSEESLLHNRRRMERTEAVAQTCSESAELVKRAHVDRYPFRRIQALLNQRAKRDVVSLATYGLLDLQPWAGAPKESIRT